MTELRIRDVDKFFKVLNVNIMAYRRLHDYRHKKHMQLMLWQDRHFSAFHYSLAIIIATYSLTF